MGSDKNKWLNGIVVPLVTPLMEDETLDRVAMKKIIQMQVDSGVDVLFVLGSTGEGPMLTEETRNDVIKLVTGDIGKKIPICVGVMDNSVKLVLGRLEALASSSIKAGVCTLPYYGWYDKPSLAIEFFLSIADKSPVPIIVYNLPRISGGISITLEVLYELFEHPNICGIKDTNSNLEVMKRFASDRRRPINFKCLVGNTSFAYELLEAGADGLVCTPANIMPSLLMDFYGRYRDSKKSEAKKLVPIIRKLCDIHKYPTTVGGTKCALEIKGICSRRTVRPWPQAGNNDIECVKKIIDEVSACYDKSNSL